VQRQRHVVVRLGRGGGGMTVFIAQLLGEGDEATDPIVHQILHRRLRRNRNQAAAALFPG